MQRFQKINGKLATFVGKRGKIGIFLLPIQHRPTEYTRINKKNPSKLGSNNCLEKIGIYLLVCIQFDIWLWLQLKFQRVLLLIHALLVVQFVGKCCPHQEMLSFIYKISTQMFQRSCGKPVMCAGSGLKLDIYLSHISPTPIRSIKTNPNI